MISRTTKTWPNPLSPNTVGAIAANTSSALSGLPRPMPSVPVPAKATEATETST
jgi:hypothetical protein